tara:strand:- start:79 stop:474 length:396 start_codon:yes stop_codon:yes gene_type:complete
MTKVINGEGAVLGRLAVYVAKESLKGESINVVNCEKIIITGRKKGIKDKLEERRTKVGSGQKGPKHSRLSERIVKRAIRGMLPNHRKGRGEEAFRRIKCYNGIPKEFEKSKKINMEKKDVGKSVTIKEMSI